MSLPARAPSSVGKPQTEHRPLCGCLPGFSAVVFSRNVVDAGRLLEEARKGDFNIVAIDLGLDLSTPTGELVANVLAAVAQWERRMIGQRTSEALQVKIAGGWTSPSWEVRVPRAVRRRIVKMAQAGMSQRAIAERLNADGVPAVGGSWHRGTVIRVLRQAAA